MSQPLLPLTFPLHGSRLIEASAGTGKTWTIAALYLRLVLGHGGEAGFRRPLLPAEILVMTFTRAATRELSDRVRARLLEAARCFRDEQPVQDDYLAALIDAYAPGPERQQAAHRLMFAAETMDEAAVFTIDAWCQRMLREHAFDSGSLFDEELVSDETTLFEDSVRDYWRQQVYPLAERPLSLLLECWSGVAALESATRELVRRTDLLGPAPDTPLGVLIGEIDAERRAGLVHLKAGWIERADRMQVWIARQLADNPKCFHGAKLKPEKVAEWFDALRAWAGNPDLAMPALNDTAWRRLTPDGIRDACNKGVSLGVPADFDAIPALQAGLAGLPALDTALLSHAAASIAHRMAALKRRARQFGFADMLTRLEHALRGANGRQLRERILVQFPVALIDEFQDTSPNQYRIFDLLYRTADNDPQHGLLLIGDPKQSIYGFRGADIHSYLAARRATDGRHYLLDTNYRSTGPLVAAVNQVFLHAEGQGDRPGYPAGAFRFRRGGDNPVPFDAVQAKGRAERLVSADGAVPALTIWHSAAPDLKAADYRALFAELCAEHIVGQLNDPAAGFDSPDGFVRLKPADIAVLVRDRNEAGAVRRALQQRGVATVYLSDKDSVIRSEEALDLLRWLRAVANPLEGSLARACFATRTAGLSLAALAELSADDLAWEARVEQLKDLRNVWQRQGVLAMLRRFIHELDLPARLLAAPGGERSLTNLLHLAELLQRASEQLDGEQALIRWLAEQIEAEGEAGEERILRLESDADLVKVVTVHKSKGLEYPLVYLPFAASARPVDRTSRSFFEVVDESGRRRLDLDRGDAAVAAAETARLGEDLRLLYVALTRPRHALWLGVAALPTRRKGENMLHLSALGYLLAGGESIPVEQLQDRLSALRDGCDAIHLQAVGDRPGLTLLQRADDLAPLIEAPDYRAPFERDWTVGSFTALTRAMVAVHAPTVPLEDKLLEPDDQTPVTATDDAPWHRFPRGSLPGNFLHEQLEWLAHEGFGLVHDASFAARLGARCERAGWGHRQEDVIDWLRVVVATPLPPVGAALADLGTVLPEMEFWFPSERLDVTALDALCRQHLLGDLPRPVLPGRQLHGMLKGYADLVFEHAGRYWVLDYKSNALGRDDNAYHEAAMATGMAAHRYEVQAAIYQLALHRLLRNRLGAAYDPMQHLGGAVFLFLRGIANPTRGCYLMPPSVPLLDALDELMAAGEGEA